MATKASGQAAGGVSLPQTLTVKDLITIISVAVSLTIAWGVFSTRITVLEKEVVAMQAREEKRTVSMEHLEQTVRRLGNRQQDNESIIDQIYFILRRPVPIRHGDK